jgi:P63C domain-containing protein
MLADDSIQSMGGKARDKALSDEQKKEIAQKAAAARWGMPKATHEGSIPLAKKEIPCAVLEDGTRLLTLGGFLSALGRASSPKGGQGGGNDELIPFVAANNLKPFIPNDLLDTTKAIRFRTMHGSLAWGYKAELLPRICEVYLDARDARALHPSQEKIATAAEIIIRGLARVGIVALIDEATGYQEVRDRMALAKILEKYLLSEGYRRWEKMFQLDYYREMFRLKGWQFSPTSNARPGIIGKLTNNLVYDRLQPGILKRLNELNQKNESGNRKRRHHQYFTGDVGLPELREHLSNVIVLMKVSTSWGQFMDMLDKAKPRLGDTLKLPLDFEK